MSGTQIEKKKNSIIMILLIYDVIKEKYAIKIRQFTLYDDMYS